MTLEKDRQTELTKSMHDLGHPVDTLPTWGALTTALMFVEVHQSRDTSVCGKVRGRVPDMFVQYIS